jgi:mannose-1-phosphate guanylyltransferase
MRPLSDVLPKPALPLPEGPVIGWPLRLAANSAQRIVINTWHLAHRMEATIRTLEVSEPELVFSREDELMGTAGGLALARDRGLLESRGPVLVVNGDVALNLSLQPLFARHAASDDLVTMALLPHLDPTRWARVALDSNGLVTSIRPPGRPLPDEVPLLYPGVMVVSRAALDAVPSVHGGVGETLWDTARKVNRLGGVVVSGHWREVGTPGDYLNAVVQQLRGGRRVPAAAHVAPSAALGSVLVGEDCDIGAEAVVGDSVVAEGAVVGRGARVLRSVLMGAVEVKPGEVVVDEFRAMPCPNLRG